MATTDLVAASADPSDPPPERDARREGRSRAFAGLLLLVALGALLLRVAIVAVVGDEMVYGDGYNYVVAADQLANGQPYQDIFAPGEPDAHHPPAWVTLLATPYAVGVDSQQGVRMFAALIGTVSVVLVGLAGRQVAGRAVGLIAATIAALSPGFWKFETELLSETLMLGLMALLVLVAYWYRDRPSLGRAAALGVTMGAALLTKADLAALLPLLVLPLVVATAQPWRERLLQLVTIGGLVVLLLAPWTLYNLGRFDEPVLLSTGLGPAMVVANCDETYEGDLLGYYSLDCLLLPSPALQLDRSERDRLSRQEALEYMADHPDGWALSVLARAGRTWSIYRPGQQINLDAAWSHSESWMLWAQLVVYWLLVVPSVAGAVLLRRRRVLLWPLLVPFAATFVTNLFATGEPRYRAPAEVSMAILAAGAFDAAWRRWVRPRLAGRHSTAGDREVLIDLRAPSRPGDRERPDGDIDLREAAAGRDPVVPTGPYHR